VWVSVVTLVGGPTKHILTAVVLLLAVVITNMQARLADLLQLKCLAFLQNFVYLQVVAEVVDLLADMLLTQVVQAVD
jgi:hypothetical protein